MLPAFQKGIHHLADDRSWPNDRHLNHDVVKNSWTIARQRGHLRTAFYLKKADSIGALQRFIYRPIILRKLGQIDLVSIMLWDQLNAVFKHGHHTEAQQIDFDEFHIGTVVFVPLHHHTSGHACRLKRNHGAELSLAYDHAARMLAEMARKILDAQCKIEKL